MTDLLPAIAFVIALLTFATVATYWRQLGSIAADAAILPFVAIGWLIGAGLHAIELAYYAIMAGYERGRGKDQL
jgi:hypothetical protein